VSFEKLDNYGRDLDRIIVELRTIIDQINLDFIQAKNLIQELARRLDELGKCDKSEICIQIKELLANKLKEHKITAKWIEECLPKEYKRKYISKSELGSLLKTTKKKVEGGTMVDTINDGYGSTLLINRDTRPDNSSHINGENIGTDSVGSKRFEIQESERSIESTDPYQTLKEENSELREALKRQTTMVRGDQIPQTEIDYKIPKEKYDEVRAAMASSMNFCHVIFDKGGILVRAMPDIFDKN
jgi:hypothetical protein